MMAKALQITFKEFRERFATEDACRSYLFRERFPQGFICPKCGCREFYPVRTRHVCQCKSCRRQTSVTAGTVMHRTHLPLTTWFWAIYLCATDKRGISAKTLAGRLELSYESAWYLLVKKRGRGTERKKMIVAVSKDQLDHPLFLRLKMVPDVTTATLQEVVDAHIQPDSTVECDGYGSYPGLQNVSVNASKYERGNLKWVHMAIGNFKAFLLGTYHGSCGNYQPYLDEYCFRFNRRFCPEQLFSRLSRAVATSCIRLS